MPTLSVPLAEWEWFGKAGHFICGEWCRFHLCTKVGRYLISTVGEYIHPRHSRGCENLEAKWLAENPLGEDIGCDRKFETMVFVIKGPCDCGCGEPRVDFARGEVDSIGCNDRIEARQNHMKLCYRWAMLRKQAKAKVDPYEPEENLEGRSTW